MTRSVAEGGQADDACVAEQVVLAVDLNHLVPEIEIGPVEAAQCGALRVHPGFPLASLDNHGRVRYQRVAADMVEMKMRVDDDVDLCRIAVDRFEPGADFLTWSVVKRKEAGNAGSHPRRRIVLAIGMHPGVKKGGPFGMLDQIRRDREIRLALSALH